LLLSPAAEFKFVSAARSSISARENEVKKKNFREGIYATCAPGKKFSAVEKIFLQIREENFPHDRPR
jgi:hypothetical protein